MLKAAAEKIKNWFNNPYWAPVTEPLKYIGSAAYTPNAPFIEEIKRGWKDSDYDSDRNKMPKLVRARAELSSSDNTGVAMTTDIGTVLGGLAAAVGAGVALGAAGVAWPVIALAAIAACGAGYVATVPLVMGALAFGGGVLGAVAAPFAIIKGCMKAYKHHEFSKTQGAVVQATPALKDVTEDAQNAATRIFQQVRDLPAEVQGPVIKSLGDKFAASGVGAAEKFMKQIEALPDADREAVVAELRKTLAPVFEAVAEKEANDSITLQKDAMTMSPIRLKKPKNAVA
ncbi:MAG: hypothetical protein EPN97_05650 [Alphaproteobacteria bacterium]|nr:MAG: hypothetical protein EPN97_05650 [Alphaproteobacteria bacterium]